VPPGRRPRPAHELARVARVSGCSRRPRCRSSPRRTTTRARGDLLDTRRCGPAAAAPRGRACGVGPATSRPTTSTGRSRCSAASTAYPLPSTTSCATCPGGWPPLGAEPAACPPPDLLKELGRMTITPVRPTPSTRSSTWSRPSSPSASRARHARRAAQGGRGRARRPRAGVGVTVRVAREDGRVVAASLVEWTRRRPRLGLRAVGRGRRRRLGALGRPLVDARPRPAAAGIDGSRMAGDVANVRMAALAEELGWPAGEVSHVYAASAAAAARWPDPVLTIRPATAGRPGDHPSRCTTRSSRDVRRARTAAARRARRQVPRARGSGGLAVPRVRRGAGAARR
jgi:hypothetical protein